MKAIVLLFAVALVCQGIPLAHENPQFASFLGKSEALQAFVPVDVSEAQKAGEVKNALDSGVQQLLQTLLTQKKITSTDFTLSQVKSIQKQPSGKITNYKFEVELNNNQGSTITATFTVALKVSTGEMALGAYNFSMSTKIVTLKSVNPVEKDWVQVSLSQLQSDTQMSDALQYGIDESMKEASRKGELPSDNYQLTKINSILTQTVGSFTFYRFNVDLTNNKGISITLTVTVAANLKTGEKVLRAYNYIATITTYTQRSQIVNSNEGFTQVSQAEIDSSSEIQGLIQFGIRNIIELIKDEGKIAVTDFKLVRVISCSRRTVGDWNNYKFQLEIRNSAGILITVTFTVRINTVSKAQEIMGFNFRGEGATTVIPEDEDNQTQYTIIDVADATTDEEVKKVLDFSVEQVTAKVLQENQIANTNFRVTKIVTIYKKVLRSGIYYKFEFELSNDEDATVSASCTVHYNIRTGKNSLEAYSYNVKLVNLEEGDYTDVSVAQALSDTQIQTALKFGIDEIVKQFSLKKKISNLNFVVTKYTSIQSRVTKSYAFYKFSVELSNGAGAKITAIFSVKYNIKTGQCTVTNSSFTYNIKTTSTNEASENEEQSDVEAQEEYADVDANLISTSKEVKTAVDTGVNEIVKKVVAKNNIQSTDFIVSKVIYIKRRITTQWTYYQFNLEIDNGEGWTITCTFTVRCNPKTGECTLRSYNYKSNYNANWSEQGDYSSVDLSQISTDSQTQTSLNFGIDQIVQKLSEKKKGISLKFIVTKYNSVQRKVTRNYIFYKFDVELSNNAGVTIYATFSITYNVKTGNCQLTASNYTYSIKTVSNQDESDVQEASDEEGEDEYVTVDENQITTNQEVKTAVNTGVNEIVKKVVSKKNIENKDFTISRVIYIRRRVTTQWTYYRFSLELDNGEGWTITCTFTIRCNPKTGDCTLRSYNYKSNYNASWSDKGDYTDVDTTRISSDAQAQTTLNYGITQIVQQFSQKKKNISNLNFVVTKYNSVQRKVTRSYVFYKFDVELTNNAGVTIYATFSITYNVKTGNCQLTASNYTYNIKTVSNQDESDVQEASDEEGENEYVTVDENQITTNQEVKTAVNTGVNEIVKKVVSKKNIENKDFTISRVIYIRRRVTTQWTYYKFSLELDNGEGWTITCTFTIRCNSKTGACTLRSYNYKSNYNASWSDKGDYTDVDTTRISSDAQAQTTLNYGITQIVQQFSQKRKNISNLNFVVTKYNSVQRKVTRSYVFYKFDIELTNNAGVTIYATFSITYNVKTGNCQLTASNYTYNIKAVSNQDESDVQEASDEEGENEYVTVDENQITTNQEVKTAVNTGVNEIVKKVVSKKNIENKDFTISRVIYIRRRVTTQWTYYKFSLELDNGEGWTITCTFTIRCNSKTGACTLRSYNYKSNYNASWSDKGDYTDVDTTRISSDAQAQTTLNYGITQIVQQFSQKRKDITNLNFVVTKYNSVQRKVTRSYVFYKFDIELTNNAGVTIYATFSITYNVKTGECQLTASNFTYNIKTVSTNEESDFQEESSDDSDDVGYTTLNTNQVTLNEDLVFAANFGIAEVAKKVAKKNKFTNTNFVITQVISAQKKIKGKFINYKFNLILDNGEGWTITTTFTVKCDSKTWKCTLKAYKYTTKFNKDWADSLDFTTVDISKAKTDAQIQAALNFGINEIVNKLKVTKKITNTVFTVTKYNSVKKRTTVSFALYRFDVEFNNKDGITISATFLIQVNLTTGESTLINYDYTFNSPLEDNTYQDDDDTGFVSLDASEYTNNAEVKFVLDYGIDQMVKKVLAKKELKNKVFTLSKINYLKVRTGSDVNTYKCDLELNNGDGWIITTTFSIQYNLKTKECTIKKYVYNYNYKAVSTSAQKMTSAEIDKDLIAKGCMDYGVNEVLKALKQTGQITSLNFKISKVEDGELKNTNGGMSYTFNLELTGPLNFTVKISLTVFYNSQTQQRSLTTWKLKSIGNSSVSNVVSSASSWVKSWW